MKKSKQNKKDEKNNKNDFEFFDDCAVCQAMKNGKANTIEELKKVFAEQNLNNNIKTMRVQNKDDLYYDAMDAINIGDFKSAEEMLLKAKDMDPDYVQTYVGLISLHSCLKDEQKINEYIEIAFIKIKKFFPKWPKKMEWGLLENRAYLRVIQYRADYYWDKNDLRNAEELYRLLLKMNPGDNQGVRYEIAAMFAGINGTKLNNMFNEGNKKQNWSKLEKLVSEQNKIHKFWKEPEE